MIKPLLIVSLAIVLLPLISAANASSYLFVNTTVINDDFGTLEARHTYFFISGDDGYPFSYNTGPGQLTIPIAPGQNYNITHYTREGYISSYSSGCNIIGEADKNVTCTITINDIDFPSAQGTWCYQESANIANACGGVGTGMYGFINYTNTSYQQGWKDGNWSPPASTFAYSLSYENPGEPGEYYVNYTKPANALASSRIKIKDIREGYFDILAEPSYQVPANCFSQSKLQFRFIVQEGILQGACWNSTAWNIFHDREDGGSLIGLTEEAMIWDIKNTTTIPPDDEDDDSCKVPIYNNSNNDPAKKIHLVKKAWNKISDQS